MSCIAQALDVCCVTGRGHNLGGGSFLEPRTMPEGGCSCEPSASRFQPTRAIYVVHGSIIYGIPEREKAASCSPSIKIFLLRYGKENKTEFTCSIQASNSFEPKQLFLFEDLNWRLGYLFLALPCHWYTAKVSHTHLHNASHL